MHEDVNEVMSAEPQEKKRVWHDFGSSIQTELQKIAGITPNAEQARSRLESAIHQADEARTEFATRFRDGNLEPSIELSELIGAIEAPFRLMDDLNKNLAPSVTLGCWKKRIEDGDACLMVLASRLCISRQYEIPNWLARASLGFCANPQVFTPLVLKRANDYIEAVKTWSVYVYAQRLVKQNPKLVKRGKGERLEDIIGEYQPISLTGRAVSQRVSKVQEFLASDDETEYALLAFATIEDDDDLLKFLKQRKPGNTNR